MDGRGDGRKARGPIGCGVGRAVWRPHPQRGAQLAQQFSDRRLAREVCSHPRCQQRDCRHHRPRPASRYDRRLRRLAGVRPAHHRRRCLGPAHRHPPAASGRGRRTMGAVAGGPHDPSTRGRAGLGRAGGGLDRVVATQCRLYGRSWVELQRRLLRLGLAVLRNGHHSERGDVPGHRRAHEPARADEPTGQRPRRARPRGPST